MTFAIRELTIADYDAALALWRTSEGIGLSAADSKENIAAYLERNPGMSLCAVENGRLCAAALCGHDGRRGYLHHVAVAATHRKQGIGAALVARCLDALRAHGIQKCHLFVHKDNATALAFWRRFRWTERDDLVMLSFDLDQRITESGNH